MFLGEMVGANMSKKTWDRDQIKPPIVFIHENVQFGTGPILLNKMGQVPLTWDRSARLKKICRYDQLRRNSCYNELGCNSLVVIALLLRPA